MLKPNKLFAFVKQTFEISRCRRKLSTAMVLYEEFENNNCSHKTGSGRRKLKTYSSPIIPSNEKKMMESVVGVHLGLRVISWVRFDIPTNTLTDVNLCELPEDFYKKELDEVYNIVLRTVNVIPDSDRYVIETLPKVFQNSKASQFDMNAVQAYLTGMLVALLNTRGERNDSKNIISILQSRIPAKMFGILLNTEQLSTHEITRQILNGNFNDKITPVKISVDTLLSFNACRSMEEKEYFGRALILTIAFMELTIRSNQKAHEMLGPADKKEAQNVENKQKMVR